MRKPLILAAAAAIALSGCSTLGAMAGAPGGDITPESRGNYVMMAAASDTFEIQSSQLARTKSQNTAVRQYADMMIQHHTNTSQQLMAAARAAGVAPPAPMLMPMQQEMMRELQAANGAAFDRVYMRQQVTAHEMALALHSNYARDGDAPALRSVAAAATPIVTQHLARARQLN